MELKHEKPKKYFRFIFYFFTLFLFSIITYQGTNLHTKFRKNPSIFVESRANGDE